jgi:Do/DeqQ family serine protease
MELREFMKLYRIPLIAAAGLLTLGIAAYALAPSQGDKDLLPQSTLLPEPAGKVPQSMNDVQLTFAPVVRKVTPAVVNVYSRTVVQQQVNPFFNDPFFQQFFGTPEARQRVQQSLGSGVIVRGDGLILTNNHVIQGGQDIVVALSDKREFKAKVVLADPRTDLAVLKIDTKGERLPAIEFGNSDRVQVGDLVLAIGDPFGVGQTVTMGIVSALARTEVAASNYQFFIQTDAAINPGNSGGALVDANGRLIGINTAIYSRSGGNIGIGFAIPANMARKVAEGAANGGSVRLPWLGVDGQPVTGDIATSLGLPRPVGVLLKSVYADGPAGRAGVRVGDVVLTVDGTEVNDIQSLNYRIATRKPGETVKMRVATEGKGRDVTVRLELPPENPPRSMIAIGGRTPLTGAKVENLSPAVANDLQMDLMAKGVVVSSVDPASIAANYGFRPGDIVRSVNGDEIGSTAELKSRLDGAGGWLIIVDRGGQRLTLRVGR